MGMVDHLYTYIYIYIYIYINVDVESTLGAKLRVTENRCVIFNRSTYIYIYIYIYIYMYI